MFRNKSVILIFTVVGVLAVGEESSSLQPPASGLRPRTSGLQPARLRCELATNPLGIDVPQPRISWIVTSDRRDARQSAYQILVASTAEILDAERGDLWDSDRVESDETIHIRYGGKELSSSQQVWWKVRLWDADGTTSQWSGPATWTMGLLDDRDWHGHWIVAPWESEALLLRHEFTIKSGLTRAVVHVCGLGQFELRINGAKVGENLLSPGWTKYDRTCLYETHDVTAQLHEGANAVGLALGDGMYHTERRHRFSKFQGTFGPLRGRLELMLEFADGSREFVSTDGQWRVARGPVTYNDIYGGEDFDARLQHPGWDTAGFDDADWEHAVRLVRPQGRLRGHSASAPAIRAIETRRPVAVHQLSDNRDVIDLGQNASYLPRITVSGPAGSTVRLTHAEVLNDDGTINRDTCGGNRGPAYWQYTKATDGAETWFPQFFYAGCRYLQVDKFPPPHSPGILAGRNTDQLPTIDRLEAVVVHSSAEPVGEFSCSNNLFNRIHTLVRWAIRSNMVSVMTDCPHREKLGWLGDCHLNVPAIQYEFDASRILTKMTRDMADSQTRAGLIPNIAPEYTEFPGTFRAAAEWGTAFIMIPWHHYLATGDTEILRRYYRAMERYMEYLASRADGHLLDEGLGDWYDWGPADRPGGAQLTPPRVTATAFYFYDAHILAKIAEVLGRGDDAERYSQLAENIRQAWRREFRHAESGTYATDSQCSHALALAMDLAEPNDRQRTLATLIQDVHDHENAMTTGIVGFGFLLGALTDAGRGDVVFDMLNRTKKPGYGYILQTGATSMTEAWDANHHASQNHYMFGQVVEWFYRHLAGIQCDPTGPGYKKIVVRPHPVGDLEWVRARYQSIRGEIVSNWQREGDRFTLHVTIPANTTARVLMPGRDGEREVHEIGSGEYEFESIVPFPGPLTPDP